MRNAFLFGAVLALLTPDLASAQGIVGGAENGAAAGHSAAGPIGGVVGGAVGGVVGGARGVLGLPRRHHLPAHRTFRHHRLRRTPNRRY